MEMLKHRAFVGHGRAASTAAMVYLAGEGVAPDAGEARKLAARAAELNDPSGLVVLGEIQCLQLMTAEDLKRYWRSDHYGALSNAVLSRPAIAIETAQ